MTMRGRCRTLRRYYLRGYSRCYSLIRFAALSATLCVGAALAATESPQTAAKVAKITNVAGPKDKAGQDFPATPRAPAGPLSCFITCPSSCILRSTLGQSGFNQQGLDAREVLLGKRPVLRWIAAPRNLYIPIQ